jgi:pimeloyl-ACP methyl ester carboxylesterase
VTDVADVLDSLGIGDFVTCGWSGGGPHALACAALLGDRCRRTATIASVAPFDGEGLDWMKGMGPENIHEFGAAVAGHDTLTATLAAIAPALAEVTAATLVDAFAGLLPAVDRECLDGRFADFMATSTRASVTGPYGIAGWRDDDLAFVRPWGFEPSRCHRVTLWQGSDDLMVPFTHGQWLAAAIADARAHLLDGDGHLSVAVGRLDQITEELCARW